MEDFHDTGGVGHPAMRCPFTAWTEHASDNDRAGKLDMIFRELELPEDFRELQLLDRFHGQTLARHRA